MPVHKENINIAIVDDHPIVIEGLQKVLMNAYHYVNTICFTTGTDFLNYLIKNEIAADIVLLDITLPDISGIQLCRQIKMLRPNICVLAFSNHNERGTIMQMLQQGAGGYMLKNAAAEEVVNCINEAMNGNIALSREVKEIMAKPTLDDFKPFPILTKREKEILKMIADGETSSVIAEKLYLSPLTVETHRRNLMQKFEVNNTAEMIKLAARHEMI
jgi:DNA-binding NarL/FixJ family response regulator